MWKRQGEMSRCGATQGFGAVALDFVTGDEMGFNRGTRWGNRGWGGGSVFKCKTRDLGERDWGHFRPSGGGRTLPEVGGHGENQMLGVLV